jgi:ubiquinone/menaquinone biosynthesis C-methylase UbiE
VNLPRTPEPKTLSPLKEAEEYEAMDHQGVNLQFVEDLCSAGPVGPQVIDLGCGPASIAIELCRKLPSIDLRAIDGEVEMLEIAKREIDIAGMLDRISLDHADVCAMEHYQQGMADTVISNSLLHHLDEPRIGLETATRLLPPGGRLFLRDLVRPGSQEEIEALVERYTGQENEIGQQLFRQSLHAALTLDEIRQIASGLGIRGLGISDESVQMTSDRHWTMDWCHQV